MLQSKENENFSMEKAYEINGIAIKQSGSKSNRKFMVEVFFNENAPFTNWHSRKLEPLARKNKAVI